MKNIFGASQKKLLKEKEAFLALFNAISEPQLKACFALAAKDETNNFAFDHDEKRQIDAVVLTHGNLKFDPSCYQALDGLLVEKKEEICSKGAGVKPSKIKSAFIEKLSLALSFKEIEANDSQKQKEVFLDALAQIKSVGQMQLGKCFVFSALDNKSLQKRISEFSLNSAEQHIIYIENRSAAAQEYSSQDCQKILKILLNDTVRNEVCSKSAEKAGFFEELVSSVKRMQMDYQSMEDKNKSSQQKSRQTVSNPLTKQKDFADCTSVEKATKGFQNDPNKTLEENAAQLVARMELGAANDQFNKAGKVPSHTPKLSVKPSQSNLERRLAKLNESDVKGGSGRNR